ncbi:MAG: cytochrome c3 family protein [Kiritimatiellaeota bacterium]|nr:cytochrome c3 family protein [Kiritimatiellota bacterium]
MKRFIVIATAVVLTVTLGGITARAGIAGTDHDLSGLSGGGTDQICIYCHTPHNAKTDQLVPLWNHTSTTTTFTLYSSDTLDSTPGQPTGASKACLSCHDGTVAIDSYANHTGSTNMSGDALLGTDLANDHPIAITYDSALASADGELVTPTSASTVDGTLPLFSASLECASCHDVHDNTNDPFLRKSNSGSALCLTCHQK